MFVLVFLDNYDLGGVDYILQSILDDENSVQWQTLLGRFYMLDRLTNEKSASSSQFVVPTKHVRMMPASSCENAIGLYQNYIRTMAVLRFSARFLHFSHAIVSELASRVFFRVAGMQPRNGDVIHEVYRLLKDINESNMRDMLHTAVKDLCYDESSSSDDADCSSSSSYNSFSVCSSENDIPKLLTDPTQLTSDSQVLDKSSADDRKSNKSPAHNHCHSDDSGVAHSGDHSQQNAATPMSTPGYKLDDIAADINGCVADKSSSASPLYALCYRSSPRMGDLFSPPGRYNDDDSNINSADSNDNVVLTIQTSPPSPCQIQSPLTEVSFRTEVTLMPYNSPKRHSGNFKTNYR